MDFKHFAPLALAPLALVSVLAAPAVAQQSPSPTPTATATPATCPTLTTTQYTVLANETFRLDIASSRPNAPTSFTLTRTAPAPVAVVRRASGIQVPQYLAVPENTSLVLADASGNEACKDIPVSVSVVPRISIGAVRNATRDYSFTGRVTPGRGQAVNLYRVNSDGSRVLTARSTVRADGTYRIDRRFSGSGRFGFEARVGNSATNLAGASPVRPTVIH